MKISAVCDPNNGVSLNKCWPYDYVNNDDGTKFEIKDARNAQTSLKVSEGFMDLAGIIIGDGSAMLLSFNKNCEALDPDSTYEEGEISACIAGVYDINGAKGPNRYGKDIIGFNSNGLGSSCSFKFGGVCFTSFTKITSGISNEKCKELKDAKKIDYCCLDTFCTGGSTYTDKYSAAVLKCGGQKNMATKQQLLPLMQELYPNGNITIADRQNITVNTNSYAYKNLGLGKSNYTGIWTGDGCNSNGKGCQD